MYIPQAYQMNDQETVLQFIEKTGFGILFSHSGTSEATHLPFIVKREGTQILLYSHMARANPHWKRISGEVLVVFSGPHTYISPSCYEPTDRKAPTWNYIAAHVYGQLELAASNDEALNILEQTVDHFEANYEKKWSLKDANPQYVEGLLPHLVGFTIKISKIEAAWKLHQDNSIERQKAVIRFLDSREDDQSRAIAELMKENLT